jgi:hypothetical protein
VNSHIITRACTRLTDAEREELSRKNAERNEQSRRDAAAKGGR